MPKGTILKLRARMGAVRMRQNAHRKASARNEEEKLEAMEERLENVTYDIHEEIDRIEKLKENAAQEHEFGWIKGKITNILLQDFVGASFGAIVFVFTQEVWDIAMKINLFSVIALALISMLSGFSLIYLSRRRRVVSVRIYHTTLLRGVEIYIVSLLTALLFIFLLGIFEYDPLLLFKGSVLIALPAVISAATADLLYY